MGGLYLEELSLSHFRSHRAARLELDGRPVAIYGPTAREKPISSKLFRCCRPGAVCGVHRPMKFPENPSASDGKSKRICGLFTKPMTSKHGRGGTIAFGQN